VKITHSGSNHIFDVGVEYLWSIILLVVDDVFVNSETLFNRLCESQDQVNPVFQRYSYEYGVHVCIHMGECLYVYEYQTLDI
jgi:hypothetical protein